MLCSISYIYTYITTAQKQLDLKKKKLAREYGKHTVEMHVR